jgi:hypothetical protein
MIKGPILIVGAGIGGLTSAIALRRKGFDVEVIEKDRISSVYGVGIIQQSNVVRAMAELGVFELKRQSPVAGFGPTKAGGQEPQRWRRLVQMLVNDPFKICQRAYCAVVIERKKLHHHDTRDVPPRVNPELRVEKARPTQAPGAAVFRIAVIWRGNLKTEPEPIPPGAKWKRLRKKRVCCRLLLDEYCADLVFAHQLHGLFRQQSD